MRLLFLYTLTTATFKMHYVVCDSTSSRNFISPGLPVINQSIAFVENISFAFEDPTKLVMKSLSVAQLTKHAGASSSNMKSISGAAEATKKTPAYVALCNTSNCS